MTQITRHVISATQQFKTELLTTQQIAFYEAFGFLLRRQALSRSEMNSIEITFETLMLEGRNGEPFNGQERQDMQNLIEHQSDFKSLMPRISNAAEQLLGPGFIFAGSSMNLFVGDSGWHADLGWHYSMLGGRKPIPSGNFYRGFSVAIYLDPLTRDNGCLRVIPASHVMPNPILDRLAPIYCDASHNFFADGTIKQFAIPPSEVPCHAIESEPGDLVFFNNQVWHASFGGKTGRRMIAISYKAKPNTYEEHEYIYRELKLRREAEKEFVRC